MPTLALEAPKRQNKWKGADLTCNMLHVGLGQKKASPQLLILRCPRGLNI
jgi:hypothetical protein